MTSTVDPINTFYNAFVLSQYELLDEQGKFPVLQVYRNSQLIITSYKADGILGKIANLVRACVYAVFSCIGMIQNNDEKIKSLKEAVGQYHHKCLIDNPTKEFTALLEKHKKANALIKTLKQKLVTTSEAVDKEVLAEAEQLNAAQATVTRTLKKTAAQK